METPRVLTSADARALGLSRGQLRSLPWLHLAHDRWVDLDDGVDRLGHLALLAQGLPDDAAFSHLTAASLLGAHVDPPARPSIVLTPRRVLPSGLRCSCTPADSRRATSSCTGDSG